MPKEVKPDDEMIEAEEEINRLLRELEEASFRLWNSVTTPGYIVANLNAILTPLGAEIFIKRVKMIDNLIGELKNAWEDISVDVESAYSNKTTFNPRREMIKLVVKRK